MVGNHYKEKSIKFSDNSGIYRMNVSKNRVEETSKIPKLKINPRQRKLIN